MKEKLSLPVAIGMIILSIFLITGSTYSFLKIYHQKKSSHPKYLSKLIQTGPQRDRLSSFLIQELLGLSKDNPTLSKNFDVKKAKEAMLKLPVINSAHVEIIGEETLYIDYTMKEPVAKVLDYPGLAVDAKGCFFPLSPFYSPKEIPEIYFGAGLIQGEFFKPLETEPFQLAYDILKSLEKQSELSGFFIKRIDVSKAFEQTYAEEEIVVELKDQKFGWQEDDEGHYIYRLRLSRENYQKELGNYLNLHEELTSAFSQKNSSSEKTIDLRIEGCALIHKLSDE